MNYEVVICIVNAGYSELVMDAAREVGARGGTVIHAKGTANKEAEQYFKITIQPDKEMVIILVPENIKDDVLHAIYKSAGLKSEGQGIAFSMAVDHVVGLSGSIPDSLKELKEEKKEETKEEKPEEKTEEKAENNNNEEDKTSN